MNKLMSGVVKSVSMSKTAVVEILEKIRHPLLGKSMKKTTVYVVHDENEVAKVGDLVQFCTSRPISKTKFFVLVKVL